MHWATTYLLMYHQIDQAGPSLSREVYFDSPKVTTLDITRKDVRNDRELLRKRAFYHLATFSLQES